MALPRWLVLVVGGLVLVFGLYRIRVGLRPDEADAKAREQGGLYGMHRRTHLLIGTIYVVMGVLLGLSGFGIELFHLGKK